MISLIKGDDPSLVAQAVAKKVDQLVGDGDKTLMVDELTEEQFVGDGGPPSFQVGFLGWPSSRLLPRGLRAEMNCRRLEDWSAGVLE